MKQGFSLVELVVVMSIIASLAGTGMWVGIQNSRRQAVAQASDSVKAALYQARSNALSGVNQCSPASSFVGWQFSVQAGSYSLRGVCAAGTQPAAKTVVLPAVVTVTPATVVFYRLGRGAEEAVSFGVQGAGQSSFFSVDKSGGIVVSAVAPTPTSVPLPTATRSPIPTSSIRCVEDLGGTCRQTCPLNEVDQGAVNCASRTTCCVSTAL